MRIRWITLFLFCGLAAAWWRGNSFEADLTLAITALLWGLHSLSGEMRGIREAIEHKKIRGMDLGYALDPAWQRPEQSQGASSDYCVGGAVARERARSETA